jgi:transposase InsO family protein
MSLKMEFVARATEPGAKLAPLCREFGISRETGHKWRKRYLELGFAGLEEQSRRPMSSPLAFEEEVVTSVLEARDAHSSWGPKKIHLMLRGRFGERTPSIATVARMLRRFGRIQQRRARRPLNVIDQAPSVRAEKPNDVWTIDLKGWWRSRDGSKCEPLTVRDAFSRYVFAAILTRPTYQNLVHIMEALFRKHGVPKAIQCDNGTPFISVRSRGGLTRLSAWWVSLGIDVVRSRRGCPQDNGAHERMHRDISRDVERFPAATVAAQQRELDRWRQEFNHVRPHEALAGKTPAELYQSCERRYRGSTTPTYPPDFVVKPVFKNGAISFDGEGYFVSMSLVGHDVGLEQLDGFRWKVWFHHIDCGELELLPKWIDEHVVPQKPNSKMKRPARHDARRRAGPKPPARRPSSTRAKPDAA